MFTTFGDIKVIEIPLDPTTKKSRGFAFLEFEEELDAESAIDNYDSAEIFGRIITVSKAKQYKYRNYERAIWNSEDWHHENLESQDKNQEEIDNEKMEEEEEEEKDAN